KEKRIEHRLQPGVLTLSGFMGTDKRYWQEIVAADEAKLEELGITAEEIADRMQYFTDQSWDLFDRELELEGKFSVETEVVRGKLPCPFSHAGIYRKAFTILTRIDTGESLRWSSLNLHLIRDHHFFEGIGSPFRLNPEDLVRILF
ncbi:MAG TPA: hypothetical protein PLX59_06585, partial [Candidatus Cloacimonadota bacterium]|nr:hypothetical protein [Candidatus Cloacimonadota bacterium]